MVIELAPLQKPIANYHSEVQAYTICLGNQVAVYFCDQQEFVRVEVPGEVEISNGKHVILVKLPDYLKAPGHLLIIFGAQNVSLFQLSPSSLQP